MISQLSSFLKTKPSNNNINMQQDYSSWQKIKSITDHNCFSTISIRSNGKDLIVDKSIQITQNNSDYVYLEIQAMKEINSPHVVKYLGHRCFHNNEFVSIYMPYYQNGDLRKYLLQKKNISFQEKMRIFIDILTGLKELHSKLIIHRDIKLRNIFVDENGRCIVGDIGIAAVLEGSQHSKVGTIPKQAPEVFANQRYDEKVDIWTTGIIAYQLFNSFSNDQLPFPFRSEEEMTEKVTKNGINHSSYMEQTSEIRPNDKEVPEDLAFLIVMMLKNAPEERIDWVKLYESGILQKYDEQKRLDGFCQEYKEIRKLKDSIRERDKQLEEVESKYFDPLDKLLKDKDMRDNLKKYPFLKNKLHEVHIFFYLELKKALKNYQFMKEWNILILVRKFKKNIQNYKNVKYNIEQRINIWLRQNDEEEIESNEKLVDPVYYEKFKGIADEILLAVETEDKEGKDEK